ncbi:TIM14 [Toxoplasma gondii ARI]|uniref:TIM14 n=1 Tax=Toxoplasma gondii ARI TaxID=1074872 RepID=A0A139XZI4_TOXGO|nr:TIM14 [Toxoplasma gondii ARI]
MWALACFLVGGAAFAARRGLRQAAAWREARSPAAAKTGQSEFSNSGAEFTAPLFLWCREKFGTASSQWRALTRDLRGFDNPMTKTEALQILKLSPTATKEKILQTHKQLMLKNHPDNGGEKSWSLLPCARRLDLPSLVAVLSCSR